MLNTFVLGSILLCHPSSFLKASTPWHIMVTAEALQQGFMCPLQFEVFVLGVTLGFSFINWSSQIVH